MEIGFVLLFALGAGVGYFFAKRKFQSKASAPHGSGGGGKESPGSQPK